MSKSIVETSVKCVFLFVLSWRACAFTPPSVAFDRCHAGVKQLNRFSNSETIHNRRRDTRLDAIDPLSLPPFTTDIISYVEPPPPPNSSIEQLSPTTTLAVFIIGLVPFAWATVEFWRRIAFGESFGTGSDSVIIPRPNDEITIGEDGNPNSSRGRRTLDKGALTVAYVLFAIAAGSVGIAVASVVMGPRPDL